MVDINASNNGQGGVIKSWSAENTGVGTDVGTNPVGGGLERIGVNSILPCLKANVGPPEARTGKGETEINLELESVGEFAVLVESQELTPGDEGSLGIRESVGERERGGEEKKEERKKKAAQGLHYAKGSHARPPWKGPRLL